MVNRSDDRLSASECDAICRRRKALKICHGDHRASWEYLKGTGHGRQGRPLDENGVERAQS